MSSVLCSQSVILGAAMAVSGAVILLSLGRQRIFPAPTPQNQFLRSCLSTGGRRKKKRLRVRFADSVKPAERRIPRPVDRRTPDNRMALYRGILRDRVHVQRMACSY